MHYVMFAAAAFAGFAAIYYWFPKFTGRFLSERWGRLHFVTTFIGFNLTFFPQHELGLRGMPRRVATYKANAGFSFLNMLSTIGSYILAVGVLAFVVNVVWSLRRGAPASGNPWDGQTLEWATTSPPPQHNFDALPPIRSERPVWDVRHPHPNGQHPNGQRSNQPDEPVSASNEGDAR